MVYAAPAMPSTQPSPARSLSLDGEIDLTNLSLEDLMNVEVTSVSKKKQSIADAPAAVSVINQDEIRNSGFNTIPDLLRMVPGVDVGRINSFTWAVGVRGLNDEFNSNLLVLQDGRSLYSSLNAGIYWDTVDYVLEDLERIEVIRGPGATLWGANAVNGVINITSKDSRDTQGWLLDTRASNDDSDVSVRYGGKLSQDTTYRAYIKAKYFNELDDADGDNAGDQWRSLRGGFRIDKHPSDANTFTLQGDVLDNRIREPMELPVPTPPFTQEHITRRDDGGGNLLGRWDHRTSEDSDFSLQMYYDYLKVDYITTNYDQNTIDLDFHHRFKVDRRNELMWGLGYRFISSHILATPFLSGLPPTKNDDLYSAFAQDTITVQPDRWSLTLGSKLEHNSYTGFEVQPSARLLWTPNKTNSMWAAVSRAVRTPARVNFDAVIPQADTRIPTGPGTTAPAVVTLLGNPNEKSEDLIAYEIGYRLEPIKSLSFDMALFYNDYQNKIFASPGAPIFGPTVVIPLNWTNNTKGHTYGGEISATFKVTESWRLVSSYSLLEAKFPGDPADQGAAPQNMAQIHSYLDITKNLQFTAGVYYVGHVSEFDIPGYVSTDLNIIWRPRESLEASIGVLNLFDNHHPEFGATGGQGIPTETPRTVFVQMSYKF
jgi:iron complex outermembrane receptor protein